MHYIEVSSNLYIYFGNRRCADGDSGSDSDGDGDMTIAIDECEITMCKFTWFPLTSYLSLMYNTCLADKITTTTTTSITTNSICCKSSTLALRTVGDEGIQIEGDNMEKVFIPIHQIASLLPLVSSITHEVFFHVSMSRRKEKNEIKE